MNKKNIALIAVALVLVGIFAYLLLPDRSSDPVVWIPQDQLPTTTPVVVDPNIPPVTPSPTPNTPTPTPNTPSPTPEPDPTPTPTPTPVPTTGSAQVIRTIPNTGKVVVLTFDAGADRGFAGQILDTLRDEGVKASFGMTGKWAEQNPDIIRRIANEGHDFINHTYGHGSFTGFSTNSSALTQAQRWQELERTEAIIKNLVNMSTKPYFRPPYGDYDASVNKDIFAKGYRFNIMWTVDSLGWKGLTAEQIRQRVVSGTVPGAVHLFHVGEQSQDAAALPLIISDLRAKGYIFGRISDLVK